MFACFFVARLCSVVLGCVQSLSSGDLLSVERALDAFLSLIANDALTEHSALDALPNGVQTTTSFVRSHFAEFVWAEPSAADSSKLNALFKSPAKTDSAKDKADKEKEKEKSGSGGVPQSAALSALMAPGAVTRLWVAYDCQQLLMHQLSARVLLQSLGDLVAGIITSTSASTSASTPSAPQEVSGVAAALQKWANALDNAQLSAFTVCQQIAGATAPDLTHGSEQFVDGSGDAALTSDAVWRVPRSAVERAVLKGCVQLSQSVLNSAQALSSAALKLVRMSTAEQTQQVQAQGAVAPGQTDKLIQAVGHALLCSAVLCCAASALRCKLMQT